jgi:hypothetical protein
MKIKINIYIMYVPENYLGFRIAHLSIVFFFLNFYFFFPLTDTILWQKLQWVPKDTAITMFSWTCRIGTVISHILHRRVKHT